MLTVSPGERSFIGGRETNEDRARIVQVGTTWCLVLSDGAGGHAGGAIAAQTVVDRVVEGFNARPPTDGEDLAELLLDAHDAVLAAQRAASGIGRTMHATVVMLVIDQATRRALWGHVGDSRLYLLRAGQTHAVTRDDSVVQLMVESGYIDPESAGSHPQKNRLLAALGTESELRPNVETTPWLLSDGDAFLLCTDGWWDVVGRPEIESTLAAADTVGGWLDAMAALVQTAAKPGHDNYSAIACWIDDPNEATLIQPAP